jgi:hypothetical protein
MTTYRMEYGKKWDVRVPRDSIKRIVGRRSVGETDDEIVELIKVRCQNAALNNPEWNSRLVESSIAYGLEVHRHNRTLYRKVMKGDFR